MTRDDDFEISEEPPRDSDGHPVHPERGHRICAATKSEKTTPTSHGRERDDYDYCLLAAGWGEDRSVGPCSKHPVTGPQWGKSNPNYQHGAYSQVFRSDLTDAEEAALEDALNSLDDPAEVKERLAETAFELILKGKRAGDPRLTREGRQLLSEFNIVEAADKLEVEHSGQVESEHSLDDETKEIIRDVLKRQREASDE